MHIMPHMYYLTNMVEGKCEMSENIINENSHHEFNLELSWSSLASFTNML